LARYLRPFHYFLALTMPPFAGGQFRSVAVAPDQHRNIYNQSAIPDPLYCASAKCSFVCPRVQALLNPLAEDRISPEHSLHVVPLVTHADTGAADAVDVESWPGWCYPPVPIIAELDRTGGRVGLRPRQVVR